MPSSSSGGSNEVDQTATTKLPEASADELALREQFGGLSTAQIHGLMTELQRLQQPGYSPFDMNLQDQQNLDAAYAGARERFNVGAKDFADFSAGGRGLRMSDTPIANQSFAHLGLGLGDIESNRARAGLDLGLQSNQYRTNSAIGLAGALPAAGTFNLGNYLQERMAQPTTHTVGTGSTSGSATPSGLQTGAALAGGVGSLAMGAAAAFAI